MTQRRSFSRTRRWVALLALPALAGCITVGPNYLPPEPTVPERWTAEPEVSAEPVDPEILAAWWNVFDDPALTHLIERAVAGNLDLRTALSRLRQARASLGLRETDRLPSLDASGSATRSGSSEQAGSGAETEFYRLGVDAGWELDLFGGVRRSIEAALAELEAREADLGDVLVTVASEIALDYVEVRSLQTRLAIAEANLEAQQETFDIARARAEAGLVSELDREQARSNLESTQAQIPSLQIQLARARHRLAVLLGELPGALDDELAPRMPIPVAPLEIAVGVPAEVLRRRPDVRSAERALAAQAARVGVTTAELYPKLRLSGSIGLESLAAGDLLSGDALAWSIGPSISWRIFDRRQIRRNIEVQGELQEQALIGYEATVLAALTEVEDALVALAQEQVRREHLASAAEAAERAVELSLHLYAAGLRDFQNVLDAQRSLLSFQDQVAVSEDEVASNLIRLYKALGGGWSPESAGA